MDKIKFVLWGYGWRADFFHRIAQALPDVFEIASWVVRTEERALDVNKRTGVFATSNLSEALAKPHDFTVLCVPRDYVKENLFKLIDVNEPILCETPPSKSEQEMEELWAYSSKHSARIQVLEQYFLQPFYVSMLNLVKSNVLGDVTNVTLSALHGYHATSMFRKVLNIGGETCTIAGNKFDFDVCKADGRGGPVYNGKIEKEERGFASLEFSNGKVAFFDFMFEQYFSPIRTRRINIQGTRGECNDFTVRFLNKENKPITAEMTSFEGVYNPSDISLRGLMFMDKQLYENPLPNTRLTDDELSMAHGLIKMKNYVTTNLPFYSLADALQDTYISFKMEEAINNKCIIKTEEKLWANSVFKEK